MRIEYLPSKITSEINGYELLLRLHNDLIIYENEDIKISFKNVLWLEANLVAILGAIIEDLEDKNNYNPNAPLWRQRHFIFAVVAQFFNIAAQGGTWAFFINYGVEKVHIPETQAANDDGYWWHR
jgi:hypothetical protein